VPATNGTGSYTVSWGTVSTATSYNLQEQQNGGGWSTVYSGSGTSTALSGKAAGSTYGYEVQACNPAGCGPWSATQAVVLVPAAPSLSVPSYTGFPGSTTISWSASSGATSYNLQETPLATNTTTTIYSGSATSDVMTAGPGQYDFAVNACNAAGCSGWTTGGPMTSVASGCPESLSAMNTGTVNPLSVKCPPAVPATVQGGTP
jgi:hypothetical protein